MKHLEQYEKYGVIFFIVLIIIILISSAKLYENFANGKSIYSNAGVLELSNNDFNLYNNVVLKDYIGKKGLMIFYNKHCPHCINMVDDVSKANKLIDKRKNFIGVVDCKKNDKVADFFEISSYPTIKVVDIYGNFLPYDGNRDYRSMAKILMG